MVPQKAKYKIPYDPEIPLLGTGYLSKRIEKRFQANTFYANANSSIIHSQKWKQTKSLSTNEGITKCSMVVQGNII